MKEVNNLFGYFDARSFVGHFFIFKGELIMKRKSIQKMTIIAILSAMAAILMLIEIPLGFAPDFYKLDFSEVPVLIGAFALGPIAGVIIEAVKILLNFMINGTITFGVGEVANFLIGLSIVVPASCIYTRHKTRKFAIIGLGIGIVSMTVLGALLNAFVLLPVYASVFGTSVDGLVAVGTLVNPSITNLTGFILLAVVPFNLVKGILVSVVVILVYKRVSFLIKGKDHDEV